VLDCEIGNVVSLVFLLNDDAAHVAAMAGNAKHFGLHSFCSIEVVSENLKLLGTLEMYSCEPKRPTFPQLELIERAACLAAIAIERGNRPLEHNDAVVTEMRLIRKRVPDWPETLN
jgi:GAF domain-containing protein